MEWREGKGLQMIGSEWMPTDQILALLIAERDRLNVAIAALQGGSVAAKRRGRPPKNFSPVAIAEKPARKKRSFTPAQRKAQAKRMKAYWAAKKKAS
jgi:hypothetical protein